MVGTSALGDKAAHSGSRGDLEGAGIIGIGIIGPRMAVKNKAGIPDDAWMQEAKPQRCPSQDRDHGRWVGWRAPTGRC